MSQGSYRNIKKYAAFIFMVFTVLSGSSDAIDSDSFIKVGKRAFIDILITNKLFVQDTRVSIRQSLIRSSEQNSESFREFLYTNVEDTSLIHIQVYIFPITILVFYLNNIIIRNNIWKNALF